MMLKSREAILYEMNYCEVIYQEMTVMSDIREVIIFFWRFSLKLSIRIS